MDPLEIKQHILEISSKLFYKNGYSGTCVNQIIEKAEVTETDLHANFESKEAICIAFLAQKNEKFLLDLSNFLETKPLGNKRIISVFDFLESLYDSQEFGGCFRIKILSDIPEENYMLLSSIQKHKENFLNFLETLITVNKSDLIEGECKMLSKQLYIMFEGAISESFIHKKKWPIATAKALFERVI